MCFQLVPMCYWHHHLFLTPSLFLIKKYAFFSSGMTRCPRISQAFSLPRSRRSRLYPGVSTAWGTMLGKQKAAVCWLLLTVLVLRACEWMSCNSCYFTLDVAFYSFDILIIHVCSYMENNWTLFSLYPSVIISFQISTWVSVWEATQWRMHCPSSLKMNISMNSWDCSRKISSLLDL